MGGQEVKGFSEIVHVIALLKDELAKISTATKEIDKGKKHPTEIVQCTVYVV